MNGSGSTGGFDALSNGGPALLAAIMGATLIIVGLIFASRLANTASAALTRDDRGRLPAGFDDAWSALRHAAYFCLAVVSLGVLLLLVPALGSIGDGSSSSPDGAVTDDEKPGKANKPGHENRGDRGDRDHDDDEGTDEGISSESPSPTHSPSAS
ncbi:MAG: hypothetical protein H0W10_01010 [Chloroflexi bacterium]|nr:hypothetical protein [Chloroflexota bacterium]